MELTETEIRVLGCLIEKERATPDQYPLTSNALRNACNQKTNREPIVDYGESEIDTTMLSLRAEGYARSITGSGRTVKHKQVLDEALSLSNGEISVLAVMMLRGPQTPNELRTRTERLHGFDGNDAVERVLDELAGRSEPLVVCIGKSPGQREARWAHLLSGEVIIPEPGEMGSGSSPTASTPRSSSSARIEALEAEVAGLGQALALLKDRFDDLADQLGIEIEAEPAAETEPDSGAGSGPASGFGEIEGAGSDSGSASGSGFGEAAEPRSDEWQGRR